MKMRMNGRNGYKPVQPKTSVLKGMLDEAVAKKKPTAATTPKKVPKKTPQGKRKKITAKK